jgi:hypothetical protein
MVKVEVQVDLNGCYSIEIAQSSAICSATETSIESELERVLTLIVSAHRVLQDHATQLRLNRQKKIVFFLNIVLLESKTVA